MDSVVYGTSINPSILTPEQQAERQKATRRLFARITASAFGESVPDLTPCERSGLHLCPSPEWEPCAHISPYVLAFEPRMTPLSSHHIFGTTTSTSTTTTTTTTSSSMVEVSPIKLRGLHVTILILVIGTVVLLGTAISNRKRSKEQLRLWWEALETAGPAATPPKRKKHKFQEPIKLSQEQKRSPQETPKPPEAKKSSEPAVKPQEVGNNLKSQDVGMSLKSHEVGMSLKGEEVVTEVSRAPRKVSKSSEVKCWTVVKMAEEHVAAVIGAFAVGTQTSVAGVDEAAVQTAAPLVDNAASQTEPLLDEAAAQTENELRAQSTQTETRAQTDRGIQTCRQQRRRKRVPDMFDSPRKVKVRRTPRSSGSTFAPRPTLTEDDARLLEEFCSFLPEFAAPPPGFEDYQAW